MVSNNYTENQLGNQIHRPQEDIEDIAERILELDLMDNYGEEFANFFYRVQNGGAGVPKGAIIMWSGDDDDVPNGWALCDGSNGTPDLRDRFVVGAGGSHSTGDTGGEEQVQLLTNELPSHSHGSGSLSGSDHSHGSGSLSTTSDPAFDSITMYLTRVLSPGSEIAEGNDLQTEISTFNFTDIPSHSHDVNGSTSDSSVSVSGSTSTTGSSDAHENRPPYYAIAYIMKK